MRKQTGWVVGEDWWCESAVNHVWYVSQTVTALLLAHTPPPPPTPTHPHTHTHTHTHTHKHTQTHTHTHKPDRYCFTALLLVLLALLPALLALAALNVTVEALW